MSKDTKPPKNTYLSYLHDTLAKYGHHNDAYDRVEKELKDHSKLFFQYIPDFSTRNEIEELGYNNDGSSDFKQSCEYYFTHPKEQVILITSTSRKYRSQPIFSDDSFDDVDDGDTREIQSQKQKKHKIKHFTEENILSAVFMDIATGFKLRIKPKHRTRKPSLSLSKSDKITMSFYQKKFRAYLPGL